MSAQTCPICEDMGHYEGGGAQWCDCPAGHTARASATGAAQLAQAHATGLMVERPSFWLIWTKKGKVPRFVHDTRAGADTEAERLARLYPGKKFVVLEAVSKVHFAAEAHVQAAAA